MDPSLLSVAELIIRCDTHRSARAANSILSVKHSDEEINLIPPHHDWDGLTLENLKNSGGPAVARLARDQGLAPSENSPDSELARVHNLNMILRHLGVSCAHFRPSALNSNQLTVNLFLDPIRGDSLVEWYTPYVDFEKDGPLITPVEVPLYLFLAYLAFFVYSNVLL